MVIEVQVAIALIPLMTVTADTADGCDCEIHLVVAGDVDTADVIMIGCFRNSIFDQCNRATLIEQQRTAKCSSATQQHALESSRA